MNILLLYGYVFGWIQRCMLNTLVWGPWWYIYIYIYIYIYRAHGEMYIIYIIYNDMTTPLPRAATRLGWGILVSTCPPVSSSILARSMSYLQILSTTFRKCIACTFVLNWKNWTFGKLSKFVTDFVLFWPEIQYKSIVWVIMERQRISSECRRSSCSICDCASWHWHNELNIEVLCCLKRVNQPPDLKKMLDLSRVQTWFMVEHRHNYDTENKPVIGRMQALSLTDSDILIPFNFVPWLLTHIACDNIKRMIQILMVKTYPMLRADQMNLKPSIDLSLHVGSTGDAFRAGSTCDMRFFSGWSDFG